MSLKHSNRKVRFFHASPKRFRHGDLLIGGQAGGSGYAHSSVCMADSPKAHVTIAHRALAENWLVYEVEPLGRVSHVAGNAEYQADQARVIRCLGRTEIFFRGSAKKVGSFVRDRRSRRGVRGDGWNAGWRVTRL